MLGRPRPRSILKVARLVRNGGWRLVAIRGNRGWLRGRYRGCASWGGGRLLRGGGARRGGWDLVRGLRGRGDACAGVGSRSSARGGVGRVGRLGQVGRRRRGSCLCRLGVLVEFGGVGLGAGLVWIEDLGELRVEVERAGWSAGPEPVGPPSVEPESVGLAPTGPGSSGPRTGGCDRPRVGHPRPCRSRARRPRPGGTSGTRGRGGVGGGARGDPDSGGAADEAEGRWNRVLEDLDVDLV